MIVLVQVHADHACITDTSTGKVLTRAPLTGPLLARMNKKPERRFRAEHVSLRDTGIPPKDYPPHSLELGDSVD